MKYLQVTEQMQKSWRGIKLPNLFMKNYLLDREGRQKTREHMCLQMILTSFNMLLEIKPIEEMVDSFIMIKPGTDHLQIIMIILPLEQKKIKKGQKQN